MNDALALGRAIEAEMVAHAMSRKELADSLGVSEAALGEYLRGVREPTLGRLRALASVLDCSVAYLIGRQEQIASWSRGSSPQSITGDINIQVSGSVTSTSGDTSAEDQGVNVAGSTVYGDINFVLPEGADGAQSDEDEESNEEGDD